MSAVRAIYADLAAETLHRSPRCDASGRCCHFDAFGHRLYVTTAELATFLSDLGDVATAPDLGSGGGVRLPILGEPPEPGCRFQVGGLCSVHTVRPFGCRIFFCDPTATDWMTDAYERYHARLRELHSAYEIPYRYVEWRAALRELGETESGLG